MDLQRLRILRQFADRGTVGAVAQAMNMTPSAVSQQLKVLGREAGIALLEQDGRRVRLTDAGRALVLRADEVIAAVQRAEAEMASYRDDAVGEVRLAMFPSGAALLLPGVLNRMSDRRIRVIAGDEDVKYVDAPALLADFDVVLTHRDERAPQVVEARVSVTTVMREPIDLVVGGGHRLAGRSEVTLAELEDEDWISVRGGFPVDDVLLSLAAATGVAPRVTHRINDFRVIESMVARDHGVALMPRFSIRDPDCSRLVLTGVRAARVYEALSRPMGDQRGAVRQLLGALVAEGESAGA
ncbi:LysR family transcriptional regulator [Williamsia sp. DF01-3]|uniref:LysR family transcriptional regulator n=1 Tax=Williamsia sp. DF01-3 TaxID=2934157 RepID=UPI001FF49F6E|nr:LysR family transcriptional regulator [Williamsia sp. DF01-3]MCK0516886.1 LysR family transcriptional regulator [Williamsia sp. DF01-3]